MFDRFVSSKKPANGRAPFIALSMVVHAAALSALVVRGFWSIDKLPGPIAELVVAAAVASPPPPPPPAGARRMHKVTSSAHRVSRDAVQPRPFEKLEAMAPRPSGVAGEEGGQPGGVSGGSKFGIITDGACIDCTGTGEGPSKGTASANRFVPQAALDANLVSGETQVTMPDGELAAAHNQGMAVVTASVKVCLGASGSVDRVDFIKRSGFSGYDAVIRSKVRDWKYRPFRVNGRAVAVCTAVNFRVQITD